MSEIVTENNNDDIDMKEDNGIMNINNIQDGSNYDIEFVDEEQEMLAEQFMTKFKSLSWSGQLLLEMKKNDDLMKSFKEIMIDSSLGFWFIVSNAIDSLELPNNNDNCNDNNGVNHLDQLR